MAKRMALVILAQFGAIFFSFQPAVASAAPVFDRDRAVTDAELLGTRGAQSWYLSGATFQSLVESDGSLFGQWISKNARTQMDVWWGSVGSQMIAESVRAGAAGR